MVMDGGKERRLLVNGFEGWLLASGDDEETAIFFFFFFTKRETHSVHSDYKSCHYFYLQYEGHVSIRLRQLNMIPEKILYSCTQKQPDINAWVKYTKDRGAVVLVNTLAVKITSIIPEYVKKVSTYTTKTYYTNIFTIRKHLIVQPSIQRWWNSETQEGSTLVEPREVEYGLERGSSNSEK